jgi:hypothetical protein
MNDYAGKVAPYDFYPLVHLLVKSTKNVQILGCIAFGHDNDYRFAGIGLFERSFACMVMRQMCINTRFEKGKGIPSGFQLHPGHFPALQCTCP